MQSRILLPSPEFNGQAFNVETSHLVLVEKQSLERK